MVDSKLRGRWCWLGAVLCAALLGFAVSAGADTAVPNTFSAGTTISSGQVNQNFSALAATMPSATYMYSYAFGNLSSTTATDLIGLTVTPPAGGFLFVTGSAAISISQTAAGDDGAIAWLWAGAGDVYGNSPSARLRVNSTSSGHAQVLQASINPTHVFAVTGGVAWTVYLRAMKTGTGSATVRYEQNPALQVLFVPNLLPCTEATSAINAYGCSQLQ